MAVGCRCWLGNNTQNDVFLMSFGLHYIMLLLLLLHVIKFGLMYDDNRKRAFADNASKHLFSKSISFSHRLLFVSAMLCPALPTCLLT